MAFELMIGGVGDAFSTDHYGTHFLFRKDGFILGIDCPDLYRRALRDNAFERSGGGRVETGDIDAMLITHLHGDHVNGLEMTATYRRFFLRKPPWPLYANPQVLDQLWDRRLAVSMGRGWDGESFVDLQPEEFFEFYPLDWDNSTSVGPFEIDIRRTRHHLPTSALRIHDGDATLAYSCDTMFDEALIEWLAEESELILHEASISGEVHTAVPSLQQLGADLRDRLLLVHYPDQIAQVDTGDLELARQGQQLEVTAVT